MKENLYDLNTQSVNAEIRRTLDVNTLDRRCREWALHSARNMGLKSELLDLVYDKEEGEIITPDSKVHSMRFPFKKEFLAFVMESIQKSCNGIVNSSHETDFEKAEVAVIQGCLYEWTNSLAKMSGFSANLDDFIHNWLALWSKRIRLEKIRKNVAFYLNTLQQKISLDTHQRSLIKRFDIDYRYRFSGTDNYNKSVTLHFLINNVHMNVHRRDDIDKDDYTIPFGPVDLLGKAQSVGIKIKYQLSSIARAVASFSSSSTGDRGALIDVEDLHGHCTPFQVFGDSHAETRRGRRVYFPFIEGWGRTGRAPCFGTMDDIIYKAIFRMDFVSVASLLRSWVSNFVVGDTSPYQQPNTMHQGIPRAWGPLAIIQGQDTSLCRDNWVTRTGDCVKIDCVLRDDHPTTKRPSCEQYRTLLQREEIVANDERILKERRLRRMKARTASVLTDTEIDRENDLQGGLTQELDEEVRRMTADNTEIPEL